PTSFTSNAVTTPIGGDYSDNGALVKVDYGFHRYPPSLEPSTDPWGTPYENFGDQKFQVTSGPERIVDELGRETTFDYCDPFFVVYLADKDQFRCVVGELRSWTDPEGAVTHL